MRKHLVFPQYIKYNPSWIMVAVLYKTFCCDLRYGIGYMCFVSSSSAPPVKNITDFIQKISNIHYYTQRILGRTGISPAPRLRLVGGRPGGLFVFGGNMISLLTSGGMKISSGSGTGSVTPFVVSFHVFFR